MSWMINSGQGLLPMAGVRTGLGFGTTTDQTAQYFQVKLFLLLFLGGGAFSSTFS